MIVKLSPTQTISKKMSPKSTLGGLDTYDSTATAEDIIKDKTAYGQGEKIIGTLELPVIQESKSVSITQNGDVTISPDEGYNAIAQASVTVNVPQPTGSITITENGTFDVAQYASAEVDVGGDVIEVSSSGSVNQIGKFVKEIKSLPKIKVMGSSFQNMLQYFEKLEDVNIELTANGTDFGNTFSNCKSLKSATITGKIWLATSMFENCTSLVQAPNLDLSTTTDLRYMFYGCTSLETIPVYNIGMEINRFGSMFTNCSSLTNEGLNNIMKMCAQSRLYGTKTLASLGLTQAQAQTCTTLSNYQEFVNAGWSTGY